MGEKSREGRREGRESRVEGVEWESRESREGDDEKREGDDELGREKCQVPQSRYHRYRNLPETPESWESRKLGADVLADVTTNKSIIQGPAGQPQIEIVVGPQLNDTNAERPVRHSYHLLSRNYYE